MRGLDVRLARLEGRITPGPATVCLEQGEDEAREAFEIRAASIGGTVLIRMRRDFIDPDGTWCGSGPERVVLRL